MKKSICKMLLALSALAGVLRLADCIFLTEPDTGFVTVGSPWLRYGLLLILVGVIVLAPARTQQSQPLAIMLPLPKFAAVLAVLAIFDGGVMLGVAVRKFIAPVTSLEIAFKGTGMQLLLFGLRMGIGLSLLAFGVWCFLLFARKTPLMPEKSITRTAGFMGSIFLYLLTLLRYAENPASIHRILRILPIFAALSALMFVVKLLGLLCVPCDTQRARTTAGCGILAFLFCTCIGLPQILWQWTVGTFVLTDFLLSVLLAGIGVLGACVALRLSDAPTSNAEQTV
ncbi:MAG: hypothetical protein RSC73_04270 [Ruthenibacterium sp.]